MDVVTRPKRAAKRGSTSALPDEDAETDEESLPSSARGSDASSEDDDEESSDEEDDLAPREPDPKAMRHSKRAATSKTVNYSTKCHPQDYALPGRKRKARKFNKKQKNSHRLLSHVEISATWTDLVNLMTGDVDNVLNGDYLADAEPVTTKQRNRVKPQMSSPRKKLRTLADDRGKGSPYKISLQSTSTDTGSDIVHLLDMLTRTQTRGPPAADTPTPVSMAYPTSYEHEAITSKGETSSSVSIAGQDSDHQMAVDDKEPRKYSDEMEGSPGDDDEQWEDLPSSDDLALRGQDESFMFVDYGDSSDDFGSEMRRTMFMNQHAIDIQEHPSRHGPQETGTDMPPNASQRDMQHPTNNTPGEDSHSIDLDQQTEDQPLPSQFEEQFAVTESQANSFDDLTTAPRYENDLCSDLANVPKRDAITNNAHVIAAANSNETSDMPSTDRPELIPENKGIGSDTKGVECVSDDHDDLTLSHDDLPRSVRSSQRTRTDTMVESDPTTAGVDESFLENQPLSSSL